MKKNKMLPILILLVLMAFAGCGEKGDGDGDGRGDGVEKSNVVEFSSYLSAPSMDGAIINEYGQGINLTDNTSGNIFITHIVATLTWQEGPDEGDKYGEEDTFSLCIYTDSNKDHYKIDDVEGNSNILKREFFETDPIFDDFEETGMPLYWGFGVELLECGSEPVGPIGFLVYEDQGNDFLLTIEYEYIEYGELEE